MNSVATDDFPHTHMVPSEERSPGPPVVSSSPSQQKLMEEIQDDLYVESNIFLQDRQQQEDPDVSTGYVIHGMCTYIGLGIVLFCPYFFNCTLHYPLPPQFKLYSECIQSLIPTELIS